MSALFHAKSSSQPVKAPPCQPADKRPGCMCHHIIQLHLSSLGNMLHELDRTGARKPGQYTAPAAPLPVKQDREKRTKRKKHDDIFNKISMHPK